MQIDLRRDDVEMLRDLLRQRVVELDREINRTDSLAFKHKLQQLDRAIERVIGDLTMALERPVRIDEATPPAERRALLVVDVQRDFCPGGALPAPGCEHVIPAINAYLAGARERGLPIYASRDWHPAVTTHFKPYGGEWPPHCVQGSPGAAFHPDLRLPPDATIISKGEDAERSGYSAFDGHTTDGQSLLSDLRRRRVDTLYVAGLATEYCVKQTTLDALRSGLGVHLLTDAIAGIDAHPGDADRALAEMAHAGAELTTDLAATRTR